MPKLFGNLPKFGAEEEMDFGRPASADAFSKNDDQSGVQQASFETAVPNSIWHDSFDTAKSAAQNSGRPILVVFTGSDWCSWCTRLKNDVLDRPEFEDWAKQNVELVELDFPRTKKLPMAVQARNQKLKQQYKVTGYPTVMILDSDGEVKGRLGYMQNPQVWIRAAESKMR